MASGGGRIRSRLLAALAVAMVATAITALPVFDRFHGADTDLLHAARHPILLADRGLEESPVVVVAITPESFTAPGLNGIPRIMWTNQMADVQRKVLDAGATVFAWDIVLQNLTAPALREVVEDRVAVDATSLRNLTRLDRPLLMDVRKYGRSEGRVVFSEVDLNHGPARPHPALIQMVGGNANLRSTNAYTDPDGIVRGVLTGVTARGADDAGKSIPSFAVEVAARHMGVDIAFPPDGPPTIGGRPIATYAQGESRNLIVNFDTRPGAVPTYTFHDVLACGDPDYLARHFAGRAVLFGLVEEFEDRKLMSNRLTRYPILTGAPPGCDGAPPPVPDLARNAEAGVYLHAHAVRDLLDGTEVSRPGDATRIGFAAILALVGAGLASAWRPLGATAGVAVVVVGYVLVAAFVFRDGTEMPLIDPVAAGTLALFGMFGLRFVTADKERARVRHTFSQYLDRKVIEAMIDSGDVPELGGENRRITCFFSDIEAFSTISEKMDSPALVAFLNDYFEIIGVEIERHGGIIERFLGDAVCAVFGAPVRDRDHAASAVRCALAIDRGLAAAQERFDVPEGRIVRTRIGINTGDMTAGNVGASRRKTYTVMGDSVNLAARLESVNKQYGTLLMAGDETVEATGDLFEWRLLDRVRVVGRASPVGLYEPLGEKGGVPEDRLTLRDAYEAALRDFQAANFEAAKRAFELLAAQGDAASAKAVERCVERLDVPPAADWDGVTDLTKK